MKIKLGENFGHKNTRDQCSRRIQVALKVDNPHFKITIWPYLNPHLKIPKEGKKTMVKLFFFIFKTFARLHLELSVILYIPVKVAFSKMLVLNNLSDKNK